MDEIIKYRHKEWHIDSGEFMGKLKKVQHVCPTLGCREGLVVTVAENLGATK